MRAILLSLFILCAVNLKSDAQFMSFNSWKTGYYYDLKGNKIEGFIKKHGSTKSAFKDHGDYILFKKTENDKKIEISSDSIISFVVDTQTFFVSHFTELKKVPFIEIVIDGKIKLYLSAIQLQAGDNRGILGVGNISHSDGLHNFFDHYYFGPNPDNLTEIKGKNFIEVMSQIMADKPLVVTKIKDRTYEKADMNDLIQFYKTGIMPDHEEVERSSE